MTCAHAFISRARKVKYLVTDNASNMIRAARNLNELDNDDEDNMSAESDCDSDVDESQEVRYCLFFKY